MTCSATAPTSRRIWRRARREGWDPLLDWARQRHGAQMKVAEGLSHVDQTPDAMAALRQALDELDAFTLGGLHVIASITGSLVLALAVVDGECPRRLCL